jgi:two-component system KDP operon response regulator KdpE
MHQGSVLIVEDDTALRRSMTRTLQAFGFEVHEASTGEDGLSTLRSRPIEVVLLDLNMPGIGGTEAAARMRASHPQLSIIVLTVRDRDEDMVAALDAGADDYVTKPFRLPELAARIRAAVRRVRSVATSQGAIEAGDITLDPATYRVTKSGAEVHLTPKEFELLQVLMRHLGRPITHHRLLSSVWGPDYGSEKEYLRTFISQLRRKIEDDAARPRHLLTDNYVGYRFEA